MTHIVWYIPIMSMCGDMITAEELILKLLIMDNIITVILLFVLARDITRIMLLCVLWFAGQMYLLTLSLIKRIPYP